MKPLLISLISFILSIPTGYSQNKYPCDSIPAFLKIGADAVVRSCQKKMTLVNEKKAAIDFKIAYTLLNEHAESFIYIDLPYDKMSRISRIKANVYDESGKLVWILKKSEIYDINGFTGPQYLDDSRSKVFMFPSYNYPYTIEYSFVIETENLLWETVDYFNTGSRLSVEESGIQVIIPEQVPFRCKSFNLKSPTDTMRVKNKLILTWQEEKLPAKKQMYFAPEVQKSMPSVCTTTERFNLEGYSGELSSWKTFGTWINKISEGRDLLNQEDAGNILALIKNITTVREKVRILYEYMQSKTRYFYIGYGIGGYQPVTADQVAKNGYGDCKALSNYMKALLKIAGIESYYTLVKAGPERDIVPDFPSQQFNHAILCVPDKNDTIWLECTSQTTPFGYLGSFTDDRHVLVITSEGGKLQRTPSYGKKDNIVNTYSEISLYGSGDADVKIKLHNSGLLYENIKQISDGKADYRKNALAGLMDNVTFDLRKEEYSFGKTSLPYGIARFDVHIRDLSSRGGDRLFFSPSFLSKMKFFSKDPTEVELKKSFQSNDTVKITIPPGYKIEYLPEDLSVDTRFGKYASHISGDARYIYFTRNLEFNKATYPKETYPEFYQFINQIAENDHKMLILKAENN